MSTSASISLICDITAQLLTFEVLQEVCGVSVGAKPLVVPGGPRRAWWPRRSLEGAAVVFPGNVVQHAVGCRGDRTQ